MMPRVMLRRFARGVYLVEVIGDTIDLPRGVLHRLGRAIRRYCRRLRRFHCLIGRGFGARRRILGLLGRGVGLDRLLLFPRGSARRERGAEREGKKDRRDSSRVCRKWLHLYVVTREQVFIRPAGGVVPPAGGIVGYLRANASTARMSGRNALSERIGRIHT
jgi:hypothetical protein